LLAGQHFYPFGEDVLFYDDFSYSPPQKNNYQEIWPCGIIALLKAIFEER